MFCYATYRRSFFQFPPKNGRRKSFLLYGIKFFHFVISLLGSADKTERSNADRFVRDIAARWKSVSVELFCVQSMLEEVVAYWKRWKTLYGQVEYWIDDSFTKLKLSEDEKFSYFEVHK